MIERKAVHPYTALPKKIFFLQDTMDLFSKDEGEFSISYSFEMCANGSGGTHLVSVIFFNM